MEERHFLLRERGLERREQQGKRLIEPSGGAGPQPRQLRLLGQGQLP